MNREHDGKGKNTMSPDHMRQLYDAAIAALKEEEEGSDLQIQTENALLDAVVASLSPDDAEAFDAWCHKATAEERINEAFARFQNRQKVGEDKTP